MTTRDERPGRASAAAGRTRGPGGAIVMTLLACALTGLAVGQVRAVWLRLPLPRLVRLDGAALRAAFSEVAKARSAEARGGEILATAGDSFATALRHPEQIPELINETRALLGSVPRSQLGRLQLAGLALLRADQAHVPIAQWWPSVAPYLEGLESASFEHFLPELMNAEAAAYAQLKLDAGTVRRTAQRRVGCPHVTFLQVFIERLQRLAAERQAAHDPASAALCRRLMGRLLRDWTLKPGPPELRLLAAELLAEVVQRDARGDRAGPSADLGQALRFWRLGCRKELEAHPPPSPLLGLGNEPDLCSREHADLLQWLARCIALCSGAVAAAVLAVGLLIPWLLARPVLQINGWSAMLGPAVALALVAVAVLWPIVLPASVEHDFRRVGSDVGWPYHPFMAAALMWVLLGLTALVPTSTDRALARRGARAAGPARIAALLLAIAALGAGLLAERSRAVYERRVAAVLAAAEITVPGEPGNDTWLDALRNWSPSGENPEPTGD